MLILTYYIPIYYQAAKNHSATDSGIDILGLMLATVLSVIISGRIVGTFGRYWHFLVLGPIPGAIGAGLLYTVSDRAFKLVHCEILKLILVLFDQVSPTTKNANVIGYQILAGVGLGTTLQQGLFASEFALWFSLLFPDQD